MLYAYNTNERDKVKVMRNPGVVPPWLANPVKGSIPQQPVPTRGEKAELSTFKPLNDQDMPTDLDALSDEDRSEMASTNAVLAEFGL